MIKVEVVFDNNCISIGRRTILCTTKGSYSVYLEKDFDKSFSNLEEAIKYCLEN